MAEKRDKWRISANFTFLASWEKLAIKEIRVCYATSTVKETQDLPLVQGTHMGELIALDYAGRGYYLRWE
jgi:hypothetical protein